ncbi:hypothetical protein PCANC_18762 [Puccinia coronata f. sp. avenae]|uniref:Uncharacterized protein n=1 Tax=Puccinia coronata f. sp. avenae TaxID=200324 RepID=A0A2N5UEA0_9BASI|nr:hypothetical protein PCANC_18762 [Puccinia coronata f. sp. avenae]
MCNNIMISTPKTQPAVLLEVQPDDQMASIFTPNSVHIQLDVHHPTNQFASNYNQEPQEDTDDWSDSQLLENEQDAKDQYSDPHLLANKPDLYASNYNKQANDDTEDPSEPQLCDGEQETNDSQVHASNYNQCANEDADNQSDTQPLENKQEPHDPPVQEPVFDMKNYCANDVDWWANTLTAEEFEELQPQGKDAWIEAFQQYVTSDFNHTTLNSPALDSFPHENTDQQWSATESYHDPDLNYYQDEDNQIPFHATQDSHKHPCDTSAAIRLGGNQELSHSDCSNYNDINNNGEEFEEHNNLEDAYNSFDCGDHFDGPDISDNGNFEDHGDYGFDDGGYDNYQEEDFYGYNEDPY